MEELLRFYKDKSYYQDLFIIGYGVVLVTIGIILASVLFKFYQAQFLNKNSSEHAKSESEVAVPETEHPVATLTMSAAIAAIFPFIANSIGQFQIAYKLLINLYFWFGLFIMLISSIWHVWAKINLGNYWSDAIKTSHGQNIIKTSAYSFARHPMYGSLFLWMIGASFAMFNWISLLIAFFIFLPMIFFRATAEEKLLTNVNAGYELYKNNVRMFLPSLSGMFAVGVKIMVIILLGYYIYAGIDIYSLTFLFIIHLLLGYSLLPEKTAFSYRSKSGMILVVYFLSLAWPPIYYLYYLILFMFIYGLAFNCPCMLVYEKYGRCPCFALLGKVACKVRK